ncbi:hypothetical protein JCM19239_3940 [Vibrio variabilis]|uniref:Uncharacterized protein n=1 Tax=Vibrio variabilis TaxID=990271 RepID=A0ABQ0J616_9VIBR|nr:hypothetical protein JCM19239_3940 [Vibrio variabilis]
MIEQKFQQFKNSVAPEDFNSIEFLKAKAQQIESEDPELSKRILVRATNLTKQKKNTTAKTPANERTPQQPQTLEKTSSNVIVSAKSHDIKQVALDWIKSPFIAFVVLPLCFLPPISFCGRLNDMRVKQG